MVFMAASRTTQSTISTVVYQLTVHLADHFLKSATQNTYPKTMHLEANKSSVLGYVFS
jgi:hypothetical protein